MQRFCVSAELYDTQLLAGKKGVLPAREDKRLQWLHERLLLFPDLVQERYPGRLQLLCPEHVAVLNAGRRVSYV